MKQTDKQNEKPNLHIRTKLTYILMLSRNLAVHFIPLHKKKEDMQKIIYVLNDRITELQTYCKDNLKLN